MTLPRSRPLARGARLRRTASIGRRAPLARLGKRGRAALEDLRTFRRETLARARGRCDRCGRPFADRDLEAHHILPRSQGGKHDAKTNGAALCRGPQGCHALVHRHQAPDWRRWLRTWSDR